MRRYYLELIIRPDTHNGLRGSYVAEREVCHNVQADNHVEACRSAIKRARDNHCLVSRFLSIRYKELAND